MTGREQQIGDREDIGYGSEISLERGTQNGAGKGTEDERKGMEKGRRTQLDTAMQIMHRLTECTAKTCESLRMTFLFPFTVRRR